MSAKIQIQFTSLKELQTVFSCLQKANLFSLTQSVLRQLTAPQVLIISLRNTAIKDVFKTLFCMLHLKSLKSKFTPPHAVIIAYTNRKMHVPNLNISQIMEPGTFRYRILFLKVCQKMLWQRAIHEEVEYFNAICVNVSIQIKEEC